MYTYIHIYIHTVSMADGDVYFRCRRVHYYVCINFICVYVYVCVYVCVYVSVCACVCVCVLCLRMYLDR